eukprot:TRINITY_DN15040_c0_g1_i1.p1 TRINITY_DN15040_c0_g1~~TRINITY_DN15040_c0_g1_i1.p1  ORF type:complete len:359 (-),score=115.68 TRINITY_DN15040_c0_g1_i1:38-1114(-)
MDRIEIKEDNNEELKQMELSDFPAVVWKVFIEWCYTNHIRYPDENKYSDVCKSLIPGNANVLDLTTDDDEELLINTSSTGAMYGCTAPIWMRDLILLGKKYLSLPMYNQLISALFLEGYRRNHISMLPQFINNPLFSDVIILVQNSSFYSHKLILNQSFYLETLLRHQNSGDQNLTHQTLTIDNIDASIMTILLKSLYGVSESRILGINDSNVTEVMMKAVELGLEELVEICVEEIVRSSEEGGELEEWVQIMSVADTLGVKRLREELGERVMSGDVGGMVERTRGLKEVEGVSEEVRKWVVERERKMRMRRERIEGWKEEEEEKEKGGVEEMRKGAWASATVGVVGTAVVLGLIAYF